MIWWSSLLCLARPCGACQTQHCPAKQHEKKKDVFSLQYILVHYSDPGQTLDRDKKKTESLSLTLDTYLEDAVFPSHIWKSWSSPEATQPPKWSVTSGIPNCPSTPIVPTADAVHNVSQQLPVPHLPSLSSLKPWQAHTAKEMMGRCC